MGDIRSKEREALKAALETAHARWCDHLPGHSHDDHGNSHAVCAAILAYGRAVREADKEVVRHAFSAEVIATHMGDAKYEPIIKQLCEYSLGEVAASAIEALEKEDTGG